MAKLASRKVDDEFNVQSAGTWGEDGLPAAHEAVQALLLRGIDLSRHRSRIVTAEIMEKADLILTMERNHKEALVTEFPQKENQIFSLAEMVDQSNDIADPMQQPIEAFVKIADELDGIIDLGFEKILQMSKAF